MSSTTTTLEHIELSTLPTTPPRASAPKTTPSVTQPVIAAPLPDEVPEDALYSVSAIPDGGFGWVVVASAFVTTFLHNGVVNCFGVLQAALLDSTLSHVPPSTLSYVGGMALMGTALYGLLAVRMMRWIGSRYTALTGISLMGLSFLGASFCTSNLPGLFGTAGFLGGLGMAMIYAVVNTLPVQYFSARLGLANGIIKLGGGVGGSVMAIVQQALYQRLGIAWTFRIQGLMASCQRKKCTLALGLPAAWMLQERVPLQKAPFVDWTMFRSTPFVATFAAGSLVAFALYVPPYYLPLFAQSIGMSAATGAALVTKPRVRICILLATTKSARAKLKQLLTSNPNLRVSAFNACNAVGRFAAGPLCDRLGPMNMFAILMIVNAASMLAIWPVSDALGPLVLFAMLNGIANGCYWTTQPTVVAGIFGPGRAAVAMSMSVTGWSAGNLMGAPIAGYLLQAAGGSTRHATGQGIEVYRPAIFYAGGMAAVSSLCVLFARLTVEKKFRKRV